MKFAILLLASAGLLTVPAQAQDRANLPIDRNGVAKTTTASDDIAIRKYWQFVECVVDRDPKGVDKLLSHWGRGREMGKEVNAYARMKFGCVESPNPLERPALHMNTVLFLGSVGGLRIARRYEGLTQPDYSSIPAIFTPQVVSNAKTSDGRKELTLYAFGECVVRSAPESVFAFLRTAFRSADENVALTSLNESMSYCLPAEDGKSVEFSRSVLRSSLAYSVVALEGTATTVEQTDQEPVQ